MAEKIDIPFRTNIFGGPSNTVLDRGPDLPTTRGRGNLENFALVDPLHISGMAEARDLKFCCTYKGLRALTKTMQK